MTDHVGQQLGNYRLLRGLGAGSFASVYLGEHMYLERPAAVKVLHVQIEPKAREDFLHEARIIARLDHPHIVRVLDFGIEDQTPYLVMEYMPNGTLRTRHPKGTRLSFEQIVSYVKQIASALDYAHQHHVVHCDVKPENVLLNAKGEIVLSDFGIAVVQRTRTLTLDTLSEHLMAGTPLYMAPEQVQGHPCPASDQYALAVMVYEWLCGAPPFPGHGMVLLSQHLYQEPPDLCERVSGLSPAVEDTVRGALAKEPSHRFLSVQDFATVLEEACFGTHLLTMPEVSTPEVDTTPSDTLSLPKVGSLRHVPVQNMKQQASPRVDLLEQVSTQPALIQKSFPFVAPLSIAQRNRQVLLRKVRSFWIEGVLNHSLHGAALLALGLEMQPEAVANPWQLMFQQLEMTPRPLAVGTRIIQVYDEASGELLILGAPGAGKTTLLLELTRDLLERTERDEQHPVPVVFNLSSWAIEQQPLVEWLARELNSRYQVPPKLAHALVEADQILPLLDGLDEVDVRVRTACIDAINEFRSAHGLLPLVVCSRSADYLQRAERVRLGSAAMVQSLTPQQVMSYLSTAGSQVEALRVALQHDADLQALATTPLMLNILILAYQGTPLNQIAPLGTLPAKQQQIFATYVERMLTSRGATTRYTLEQMRRWLSFQAQKMKRRGQTIFYIESIQPDWLVDERMLRKYEWLAIRLPYILIGVLVSLVPYALFIQPILTPFLPEVILFGGLLGGLIGGGNIVEQSLASHGRKGRGRPWYWPLQRLGLAVILGSVVGLSIWKDSANPLQGLLVGSNFAVLCFLLMLLVWKNDTLQIQMRGTPRQEPIRGKVVFNALLVGLLTGLSIALSIALQTDLGHRIADGLIFLLFGALSGGVLTALLVGRHAMVQPTDRLIWTWRGFGWSLFSKQHISSALLITVLGGLLFSALAWLIMGGAIVVMTLGGLLFGSVCGLCYWLLVGFFRGVASMTIDDQLRVPPNQGIRHSARNALRYGLAVSIPIGLVGWLLSSAWLNGLIIGLSVGLLVGLFNGGLACLRHYTLRILLWRAGAIPWDYSHFLDAAAERVLLRKVGGGHIFLHRLLLDYLTTVETGSVGNK